MRGVFSKYGQLVKTNNQNVDSLLALTGAYREVAKSTNLASTGKEFILNESAVNSLGLENIEYMNKYGELPFNMLTDTYIPDLAIPPTSNLLTTGIEFNFKKIDEPIRTNDKILDKLLKKENKTDNRIEVLIKIVSAQY